MNVVELSSAIALSMQAASARTQEQQERLYTLAYKKFEGASAASPSNLTTFKYWALALLEHARLAAASDRASRACVLLQEADSRFAQLGPVASMEVVGDHAACVRLLASLSAEPLHAAGLFVRAVALGMSALREEDGLRSAEETCVAVREYAGHCSGDQAYRVLSRVRDSLLDARLKKQHNAFSMLLMDLSDVGLDVNSCRTVCEQLVRDGDQASLRHLVTSCIGKFEVLPSRPLVLCRSVLEIVGLALACFADDQVLLGARCKAALLTAASQPLEMDDALANQVLAAAQACKSPVRVVDVLAVLEGLYLTTLFVENVTYQTRSSLPLEQFAALADQAVWDSASSTWLPSSRVEQQLLETLARVSSLCVALLEVSNLEDVFPPLPLSRLCALFGHSNPLPSPQLTLRLSCGSLVLQRAFGVDHRSVERVATVMRGLERVSVARGAAPLLAAAAPFLNGVTRLDLSLAVVVERFPEQCAASLQELLLPPRFSLPVLELPKLVRLHLAWKPSHDGLHQLLLAAPSLLLLELPSRENKLIVVNGGGADGEGPCSRWCRAVSKQLLLHPHQFRDAAKLIFRAFLPHDGAALVVMSSFVFVNGSVNGAVLNLIRKLGLDLLLGAARRLSNADLFDVLLRVDQLDSYDASSALNAFISSLANLLFSRDASYFSKALRMTRPARLPSLLASLAPDLARSLALTLKQPNDAVLLLTSLMSSSAVVDIQALLMSHLYTSEPTFAKDLENRLASQFAALRESPRDSRELFLSLQCKLPVVFPWSGLSSCHLVDAPGLSKSLLSSLVMLLPRSLLSFSLRYRDHVRSPVMSVDNALLASLTGGRELTSLILDLTPELTNEGLASLCSSLRVLQLRSPNFSDEGVDVILDRCRDLQTLRLQGGSIRDICLSKMGSHGRFETLELFDCPLVTFHGLERLLNNSTTLTSLKLQDCRHCVAGDVWQTNKFLKLLSKNGKNGEFSCTKSSFEYMK